MKRKQRHYTVLVHCELGFSLDVKASSPRGAKRIAKKLLDWHGVESISEVAAIDVVHRDEQILSVEP